MNHAHPRVFVVHETLRPDPNTGALVADKDLSPAEAWGELVHVVPPGRQTFDVRPVVGIIEDALADITDDDYLLLTGYPEYIAIAGAVASYNLGGRLRLLKWNRRERVYSPITVELSDEIVEG